MGLVGGALGTHSGMARSHGLAHRARRGRRRALPAAPLGSRGRRVRHEPARDVAVGRPLAGRDAGAAHRRTRVAVAPRDGAHARTAGGALVRPDGLGGRPLLLRRARRRGGPRGQPPRRATPRRARAPGAPRAPSPRRRGARGRHAGLLEAHGRARGHAVPRRADRDLPDRADGGRRAGSRRSLPVHGRWSAGPLPAGAGRGRRRRPPRPPREPHEPGAARRLRQPLRGLADGVAAERPPGRGDRSRGGPQLRPGDDRLHRPVGEEAVRGARRSREPRGVPRLGSRSGHVPRRLRIVPARWRAAAAGQGGPLTLAEAAPARGDGPAVPRRRGHPRRLTPNPEAVRAPYTRDEQRPDQRKDGPMHTWHSSTLVVAGLTLVLAATSPRAASHREAPLMTLDPAADITDVYTFVSYDTANLARASADRKVTLILNVIPAQEPSSGPNYFAFDDNVLYELHVDNNKDGDAEDVIYQFRFQTTVDTPAQFVATLALPPVTALEGPNAAGMAIKQR